MVKLPISKTTIRRVWSKYSLIVVGNIVFFVLLYFFSYRPHSDENRAGEFLSMAQSAETNGRHEAAIELYRKVIGDYSKTRAAGTAKKQLARLKKKFQKTKPEAPQSVKCAEIDIEEMLRKKPSVYIATYLADHVSRFPADKAKLKDVIKKYLAMAVNQEGTSLAELAKESEFQSPEFKREFFDIRPKCTMETDWIYDNFSVKNSNFYPWHNVNIELSVSQGAEKKKESLRIEQVKPGESVELLEFRVQGGGGAVTCQIDVQTQEGNTTWKEKK
ncbi:MAG: hypothetical protein GY847_23405 [Proteobacteria bacterium]|nr:hypothetical protein [Pseudomonadota bacterium]